MKNIFLITCICFISQALGQNFKVGGSLGFVASQVDGDRLDGYDKPGFKAGIFVTNTIIKNWSFSMGIDYIQKGSRKLSNPDIPDDRFYILRLNYMEVPFLFQYLYKSKYIAEVGLVFGYLYRAREDVDGYGFADPDPPFKSYDIPVRWGIGYQVSKHFSFKLHQSYSILPIRNHPANQTWYFNRGQYNNYIILSIYYTL
ncbi:MAG: PorT family protein [Bacteroidales bacterium]|nr:PorT family protein [Bacteroidales bacterium]